MNAARLGLLAAALASPLLAAPAAERFRQANDLVRSGDYPKATAVYGELAASGQESASLYWNWAQAATARGASGEALWALLRARELDPGDRAVARDVERLRESLNLDPAEIAPEPLAAAGRASRRFHLDLVALGLLVLSLGAHALLRVRAGGSMGRHDVQGRARPGHPRRRGAGRRILCASHRRRRPARSPTSRCRLTDGRDDGVAARGRGRAGARSERRLAARRGQRRRARLGALGGREAPRQASRPGSGLNPSLSSPPKPLIPLGLRAQARLTGSSAILHATECRRDRRCEQARGKAQEETMAESLAIYSLGSRAAMTSLKRLVEDYERRLILEALSRARGNQRRAAAELGCLPTTLNEKMRRLGLRACDRPETMESEGLRRVTDHGALELTGTA